MGVCIDPPCGTTDGTRRQVQRITAIQRQFVYFTLVDDFAEGRSFRLNERRLGSDFNLLAQVTDLKGDIDFESALDLDVERLPGYPFEAGLLYIDFVVTDK